ncbi:MAG TPA: M20 family metallopeptidase [Pseudonocardiaceae bacterium]|jgi:amidohydrolase|nr:M20 family metallopeptidase [Pseudonocardiaceae bacterium]
MGKPEIADRVTTAVRELAGEAEKLSRQIHAHPETAFHEFRAAEQLCAALDSDGFTVTSGLAGLPTAFRAEWGHGKPRIAYLLEYDALPGVGHGCGHNLIAAGGLTAARSLRRALEGERFAGTITVIGTPAEEGGGGKILELDAGVFDDIDAALMFHPADRTIPWRHSLACAHLKISFRGRAAHAAKNPEEGRNALAAMVQFFVAVDGLRQHIGPHARLHGVITHGGDAPNVVPDLTEAEFLVRHRTVAECRALQDRVQDCARGAALATGTSVSFAEPTPLYAERKNNRAIATRIAEHLAELGTSVEPASTANPAGSSDIGNVSQRLPTVHPYLQIAPRGTASHSAAFRDAAVSDQAHTTMLTMATALAQTGADLLLDDELLAIAREEFAVTATNDLAG